MTVKELQSLKPGMTVKIIDYIDQNDPEECDKHNFASGMAKYLGMTVTVLKQLCPDHILIEEDDDCGLRDGHWAWKNNMIEFAGEIEPDDTASDDDVLNVLFS